MRAKKPIEPALTESEIKALAAHHADVLTGIEGGAKYDEIATTLDIPIGTVRSRINRARRALDALRAKAAEPAEMAA